MSTPDPYGAAFRGGGHCVCERARLHYAAHGCLTPGCDSPHDGPPPPPPPRREARARTLREWWRGEYPLTDGCVVREGQTCPHGLMVRVF